MAEKRSAVSSSSRLSAEDEPAHKKQAIQSSSLMEKPSPKPSPQPNPPPKLPKDILEGKLTPRAIKLFKKEALCRALNSYRRSAELFESQAARANTQLNLLQRVFSLQESWWSNFADQIAVAIANNKPFPAPSTATADLFLIPSSPAMLKPIDEEEEPKNQLEKDYDAKSAALLSKIKLLLKWDGVVSPDNDARHELAQGINKLHTFEAEYNVLKAQTCQIQQQLTEMTEKYLEAKRAIARLESPVTMALFGRLPSDTTSNTSDGPQSQPDSPPLEQPQEPKDNQQENHPSDSVLQAVIDKQIEQLGEQDRVIASLNESLRNTTNRLAHLSDQDLQHSYLYRNLRRKNEDLIYQLNKLEALTSQYHREKSSLVAERAGFQDRIRRDADARIEDLQARLNLAEADVARIRAVRDDILGSLNIKKAQEAERLKSLDHFKELLEIRDRRIKSLEQEVARIKSEDVPQSTANHSLEDLQKLVAKLQQQNTSLVEELPELEAAFNQAHQKATAKIMDFAEREARMNKLVAEKAKADEKYFSAMRAKDQLHAEFQKTKSQLKRNAEWVQQLKESDEKNLHQVGVLELRVEELQNKAQQLDRDKAFLGSKLGDYERRVESLHGLVDKLKEDLKARDKTVASETESRRLAEVELARTKKQLEISSMANGVGAGSGAADLASLQIQELRTMAICSVCSKNWKDTAIKVCGHVFCHDCATERLHARLRKCPLCNKQFSHSDLLPVHL